MCSTNGWPRVHHGQPDTGANRASVALVVAIAATCYVAAAAFSLPWMAWAWIPLSFVVAFAGVLVELDPLVATAGSAALLVVLGLLRGAARPALTREVIGLLLYAAAGGPQLHFGRPTGDSHRHLAITEDNWAPSMDDLHQALAKFQVLGPEEQALVETVEGTREAIVVAQPLQAGHRARSRFVLGGDEPVQVRCLHGQRRTSRAVAEDRRRE
jgi:hypothetical protein